MVSRYRPNTAPLFWLLIIAVVAACATKPVPPATPPPLPFAGDQAQAMFRTGYGDITERYIEPVTAEQLATAGLRGFSDIDPALAVGLVGRTVVLTAHGHAVTSTETPKARDVDAWAALTVDMWRDARRASPTLAATSDEAVYQAIFRRALATLDPLAKYSTAAEADARRHRRDGYNGIGLKVVLVNGQPTVSEVFGRGPAERSGLRVGDALLQINGRSVTGLDDDAIRERVQEDQSGLLRLTVRRSTRGIFKVDVLRGYIIPETVEERYEDGIIVLKVRQFNQGTADSIGSTLSTMSADRRDRLQGVILDLRGNPGGLLNQAVKIADLFLTSGHLLATRGRHPESNENFEAGADDVLNGLPVVVLIDGETASAAELAAGILQERNRAIVVGSSSYGKGTVQTILPMPNGGELSFTWSRAVLPSGTTIVGTGVPPTVCTSGLYVADEQSVDRLLYGPPGPPTPPSLAPPSINPPSPTNAAASARVACPAETRREAVDMNVAKRILGDPSLTTRLLTRPRPQAARPAG